MLETVTDTTEAELVFRAQAGSVDAFTELVRLQYPRVHNYLARAVRAPEAADDLAQEVFLRAFCDLGSYKGEAPLISWLLGVARHQLLAFLRRETRRQKRLIESMLAVEHLKCVEETAPEEVAEEVRALNECLKQLPSGSQRLVKKHYLLKQSATDIGDEMGKKPGAIRMTLLRIRRGLRKCIEHRLAEGSD